MKYRGYSLPGSQSLWSTLFHFSIFIVSLESIEINIK